MSGRGGWTIGPGEDEVQEGDKEQGTGGDSDYPATANVCYPHGGGEVGG